jgi:hypothetical protein
MTYDPTAQPSVSPGETRRPDVIYGLATRLDSHNDGGTEKGAQAIEIARSGPKMVPAARLNARRGRRMRRPPFLSRRHDGR